MLKCSCGNLLPKSLGFKPRKHCSRNCAERKRKYWLTEKSKAARKIYQARARESINAASRTYANNRTAEAGQLIRFLKSCGCSECGEMDSVCLDFHHRDPTSKKYLVSQMVQRRQEAILAEASKCIVLCANCHRRLEHAKRKEKRLAA